MPTLYILVGLLPFPVYHMGWFIKLIWCCQISFSVYPAPVIAQVFLPARHLPKYWYCHPIKWRRIIIHLLIASKRCSFTPPLAVYETACVTWCPWSRQTFVKAREKALDMRLSCCSILRKFGQGMGSPQPEFLEGWIPRQAGTGWYDRRGWAAGAVSQFCFPEKVQNSTPPTPTYGHPTSPDQLLAYLKPTAKKWSHCADLPFSH